MAEKEVYVFFDKDSYKTSKASILETKIELVKIQKRIRKIKSIRAKKKKNIVLLKRYIDRLKNRFEPLYNHIGKDDLPKELEKRINNHKKSTTKTPKEKIIKETPKEDVVPAIKDDFGDELAKIQEQLKRLGV